MSTTTATNPPLELTKLYIEDLPKLERSIVKPVDIALYLRNLVRWSNLNGMVNYLEGPPPADYNATLQRDCLRYLSASLVNHNLRGAFADQTHTSSQAAFKWMKEKLLHGMTESQVLKQKIMNSVYDEKMGLQGYVADFTLYHSHISPVMPADEAANALDSSLPSRLEPWIFAARQNPGLKSIKHTNGAVDEKRSFQGILRRNLPHGFTT